tara:strand:+ start:2937 stop:3101 length:165 start_codon:yes stop_codon:yes gene_type:complete
MTATAAVVIAEIIRRVDRIQSTLPLKSSVGAVFSDFLQKHVQLTEGIARVSGFS